MRTHRVACLLVSAWLGSACGAPPERPSIVSLDTLREAAVIPSAEYLKTAPYRDADQRDGERVYKQCQACHSLAADAPPGPGPGLLGLFGRQVGTTPNFPYSQALRDADFRWTPLALDSWLARPLELLPGSQMAFGGIYDQDERTALIAYLLVSAGDNENVSD